MCYEVSETRAGGATRSKERRGGQGGVADVAAGRRAGPRAVRAATRVLPVGGHNRAAAAASARPPLQRPVRCSVGSSTRDPNPQPGKQQHSAPAGPRLEGPLEGYNAARSFTLTRSTAHTQCQLVPAHAASTFGPSPLPGRGGRSRPGPAWLPPAARREGRYVLGVLGVGH